MKEVEIYTDGACSGNPGAGGWAAVLSYNGREKEISGGEADTTNNRMELTAAIEGLSALKEKCRVKLYSDSQYLISAFNDGWIYGWIKSEWKTADKKPVKNDDLFKKLYSLATFHEVTFIKVKGHSDNAKNNRCDELARGESERIKK